MSDLRTAVQQALEAWQTATYGHPSHHKATLLAMTALSAALAQRDNKTPITDDHGKALLPQYQVIEQRGNWVLLYDQMQDGEKVRHEFRIQKLRHDVALYPGITLSEALKRFHEKVGADHE